ncbi:MAG: hypothetical protein H6865_08455 [Rhodospirillales bacterium]|nr:hypothetical protein [Alphaproteobacteria bacterium]MCB9987646.1 hypothetical protein [Rhodospirillales bacterium]USO08055.1 MAG: hypothetical protein H6866_02220 [Rhodospirillales bacterium]
MKTALAFADAAAMPATPDLRERMMAAFNAQSPVAGGDGNNVVALVPRNKNRDPRGGSDGGPPAGMVMPDMSIGAVPFYG